MTTTRIPLVAQINVTIVSQAVTAAYGSAGDLVNYSAACSSVLLRNPGEVWPIEFKVGSGAWQRLEIYNTTLLGISLDTTTIRVRKALANSGSGLVQLDIRGLASTYLAGDDAVDLGGEDGGAAAFTDLTDAPSEYTGQTGRPSVVNAAEDGLRFSGTMTENSAGTHLTIAATAGVAINDSGSSGVSIGSTGSGGVTLNAEGDDGWIYLNADEAVDINVGASGLNIMGQTAVATQSVLVAGVGTMVFTHGILTSFTPA